MKDRNWVYFVLGALAGAGITWLLTSEEGKEVVKKGMNKLKALAEEDGIPEETPDDIA